MRAITMASCLPTLPAGGRGGEDEACLIGCGRTPDGAVRVVARFGLKPGGEQLEALIADAAKGKVEPWLENCLWNPRVGVCDQVRYLRLRVTLLVFCVNAACQRND